MQQAAKGDKAWEDGGVKKTLAHAAMGAAVATIANGNTANGAIGAAAAEATRELTKNKTKATQQIASSIAGSVTGATGASVALDGERYNRQLHQKEIEWLRDKKNIQAFIKYMKANGKILTYQEAKKILARGGAALVDKSWNDKLANDNLVKGAKVFIKNNYSAKSYIFNKDGTLTSYESSNTPLEYTDPNGDIHFTNAFNPDEKEYNDRYANIVGFVKNKEFYKENLNFNSGKIGSGKDYAKGVINPLAEFAKEAKEHPKDTAKAVANSLLHPIDSLKDAGSNIRTSYEKGQLDALMGDDKSALKHYGEASSSVVIAVGAKGVSKGISKGAKAVNNALNKSVDEAFDISLKRPTAKGEVGEAIENTPSRYSPEISAEFQDNIDETLHYITNGANANDVPKRIKQNWGRKYENKRGELPDLGENGYKEFRVRGKNKKDQLHRIVVGKDGNYYYTNTHYGDNPGQPFYYGGKLTPEQVKKIFGE